MKQRTVALILVITLLSTNIASANSLQNRFGQRSSQNLAQSYGFDDEVSVPDKQSQSVDAKLGDFKLGGSNNDNKKPVTSSPSAPVSIQVAATVPVGTGYITPKDSKVSIVNPNACSAPCQAPCQSSCSAPCQSSCSAPCQSSCNKCDSSCNFSDLPCLGSAQCCSGSSSQEQSCSKETKCIPDTQYNTISKSNSCATAESCRDSTANGCKKRTFDICGQITVTEKVDTNYCQKENEKASGQEQTNSCCVINNSCGKCDCCDSSSSCNKGCQSSSCGSGSCGASCDNSGAKGKCAGGYAGFGYDDDDSSN